MSNPSSTSQRRQKKAWSVMKIEEGCRRINTYLPPDISAPLVKRAEEEMKPVVTVVEEILRKELV